MKPTYRIKDWDAHFENNRTRELRELRFVILPNKQDGDGYTELLDHPNGAAHFGAWCSLVQVASKCDPRGSLLRDAAKPHDSVSLARLTRLPKTTFDEALPRLVSIGWIEISSTEAQVIEKDSETSQAVVTKPQVGAEECGAYRKGIELERKELNRKEEKKEMARAEKPRSPSKPKLCDEDYLNDLQGRMAYQKLDVHLVHSKMLAWCENKGKQPTRGRLISWLNNEDQPMERSGGKNQSRPESSSERNARNLRDNCNYIRGLSNVDSQADREDPVGLLAAGPGNN